MKIAVVGTRGIPDIQGGVETHCQELYPRLAAMGHDVTVVCRTPYLAPGHPDSYKGVSLLPVYAPRRKSLEATVHTFLALLKVRRLNPDIVHIHAIGPALLTPMARLLGMKVVTTNHGPDYDRAKWGRLARFVLRSGERMGARYSNAVIVISRVIADIEARLYGRTDTRLIFNGVNTPVPSWIRNLPKSTQSAPPMNRRRRTPRPGLRPSTAPFSPSGATSASTPPTSRVPPISPLRWRRRWRRAR